MSYHNCNETLGWGSSRIATKYVYEQLNDIKNSRGSRYKIRREINKFLESLAHNYQVDTGNKIMEEIK